MGVEQARILQVITGSDYGGAQQHLLWLCEGLRERGFAVSVACQPGGYLVERMRQAGIPVLPLPDMARSIDPIGDLRTFSQLGQMIREARPDLVHAHSSKAGALARLAAARMHVPAVFTAHGLVFSNSSMAAWKRLAYGGVERILGLATAHLIAVSTADGELARRHALVPPRRLTVIHNGVPVPPEAALAGSRAQARRTLGLNQQALAVGVIARLHPDKDLATWLRAAALVSHAWPLLPGHRTPPELRFVVIGDGPESGRLRRLGGELGLEGRVHWAGERPDAAALLPALDLFVLSSVKEGLPLTVLEAMAAGLPVVATAVGGVPDAVVPGRTGVLVQPGNSFALSDAALTLLQDQPRLREMGYRGRERVLSEFSLSRMIEQTVAVYRQLLANGGGG